MGFPLYLIYRLVNAATGTGKTVAYLAPVIHQLQKCEPRIQRSDGTFGMYFMLICWLKAHSLFSLACLILAQCNRKQIARLVDVLFDSCLNLQQVFIRRNMKLNISQIITLLKYVHEN